MTLPTLDHNRPVIILESYRPKVKEYTPGRTNPMRKASEGFATFKCWSLSSDGTEHYPAAVVELSTGEIRSLYVENVVFSDQGIGAATNYDEIKYTYEELVEKGLIKE